MGVPSFDFTAYVLTITTDMLVVKIHQGEIIYIKDIARNEVLLDTAITTNRPAADDGFCGCATAIPPWALNSVYCFAPAASTGTLNVVSDYQAALTYTDCYVRNYAFTATGSSLVYTFDVDSASGEISITLNATNGTDLSDDGNIPFSLDIPIINFGATGTSVIAGTRKILFADATETRKFGFDPRYPTPENRDDVPLAIGQGASSCFGVWSENDRMIHDCITVQHTQNSYDNLILHADSDSEQRVVDTDIMVSGPWRITTQATWLDVAKRWRAVYNAKYTDAKYLWEKTPTWIRGVHCRYGHTHWDNVNFWDTVAAAVGGGSKVAMDCAGVAFTHEFMILQGQITPRLLDSLPGGSDNASYLGGSDEYPKLLSNGFNLIGYNYWYTVHSDAAARLTEKASWIPPTWTYPDDVNMDYPGDPNNYADWLAYFDRYGGYLHPGSAHFQTDYIQMSKDYAAQWNMSGQFWDTCAIDRDGRYDSMGEPEDWVINGYSFLRATRQSMKLFSDDYAIVHEYSNHLCLPYTFYVWVGPRTWNTAIEHPLRAALIGSYCWTLDISLNQPPLNMDSYNIEQGALMACIPEFSLAGTYSAPTFGCEYYTARAKMFCDYEMYNDLPDTWTYDRDALPRTLAYYRTNSTGMFKYIKRATGRYAYLTENGAYILQHELKTGESTGHKTFTDTYTSIPTVTVSSGTATNITLTGFDYTVGGTGDWLAFGEQPAPTYSRGDYVSLPGTNADLKTPYSSTDVTYVATDDDTTYVSQGAASQYAIHEFKNDATGKSSCTVTWNGQSNLDNSLSRPTILEIYNTDTSAWEELNRNTSTLANTDFTLSFPIVGNLDDYKDANGFITCRVYQSGS